MSSNDDAQNPSVPNDSSELAKVLLQSLACCCRLESWAGRKTDSPLISLAQSHIRNLIAEVRLFAEAILSLNPSAGILDGRIRTTIAHISHLITTALGLLEFCLENECDGDEGELNALLAKTHFLDENRSMKHPYSSVIKCLRNLAECVEISNAWTGPNVRKETHIWGVPCFSISPEFLNTIAGFVQKVRSRQSPRYVHTYPSESETLWRIDLSVMPPSGSSGVVRKVTLKDTGQSFAQKSFQGLYHKSDRSKVIRELVLLEVCHHPNIVDLVEAYETADDPYALHIVMAPWAPYTLAKFLHSPDSERKKAFPWFELNSTPSILSVYRIMLGLASAVGHLHGLSQTQGYQT
ncbi:hypothetical protein F5Y05DRAFT_137758 [Hypoxylon sp. FL0543]|nr:hypothetical protein F5Y05DRAFT_137758 [Hypoxylon sp. FL0543]